MNIHHNNKTFVQNLKQAQEEWIKFRELEVKMKLTYANMPGNFGTMNDLLWAAEMQTLTENRIKVLQSYINQGLIDQPD